MKHTSILVAVAIIFSWSQVFSQDAKKNDGGTATQMEQMQKLMDNQTKTMERITNMLPTATGALNSLFGMAKNLEDMQKERNERVTNQTSELDVKTDEVLSLIDKGQKSRAKIKALRIKWTPIGVDHVDTERSAHFDGIREEVLKLLK